ncbi:MAG: hypothetical protein HY303_06100 [Candidatus Wallbacteria bacterium]|nr:hypothetical protein [Candidatus Wallbacteria bacterium]
MKRIGLLIVGLALGVSMAPAETDYIASGYQYIAAGDLERAERMFKAAIKINVDDDAAWEGLKKVHALQAKRPAPVRGAVATGKRRRAAAPPADEAAPRRMSLDDSRSSQAERPALDAPAPEAAPAEEGPSDGQVEEINKKLLTKYLGGGTRAADDSSSSSASTTAKGKGRNVGRAHGGRRHEESSESKPAEQPSEKPSDASESPKPVKETFDETIDKDLLKNGKKANEEFNHLRDWATTPYKRESNGATQFIPTYYSPQLYKLLVTKLAAQKNWSISDTQKKYRRLMADNSGVLEFYVKLINTTRKPKAAIPVGDICDRTTLEDDNGNSYKPMRFKAPSVTKLLDEDSYTVWFPKFDADGNSVVDKAKEKLFLVVNDQEQEPATIRIPFTKKQFEAKVGRKGGDKPWWKVF